VLAPEATVRELKPLIPRLDIGLPLRRLRCGQIAGRGAMVRQRLAQFLFGPLPIAFGQRQQSIFELALSPMLTLPTKNSTRPLDQRANQTDQNPDHDYGSDQSQQGHLKSVVADINRDQSRICH